MRKSRLDEINDLFTEFFGKRQDLIKPVKKKEFTDLKPRKEINNLIRNEKFGRVDSSISHIKEESVRRSKILKKKTPVRSVSSHQSKIPTRVKRHLGNDEKNSRKEDIITEEKPRKRRKVVRAKSSNSFINKNPALKVNKPKKKREKKSELIDKDLVLKKFIDFRTTRLFKDALHKIILSVYVKFWRQKLLRKLLTSRNRNKSAYQNKNIHTQRQEEGERTECSETLVEFSSEEVQYNGFNNMIKYIPSSIYGNFNSHSTLSITNSYSESSIRESFIRWKAAIISRDLARVTVEEGLGLYYERTEVSSSILNDATLQCSVSHSGYDNTMSLSPMPLKTKRANRGQSFVNAKKEFLTEQKTEKVARQISPSKDDPEISSGSPKSTYSKKRSPKQNDTSSGSIDIKVELVDVDNEEEYDFEASDELNQTVLIGSNADSRSYIEKDLVDNIIKEPEDNYPKTKERSKFSNTFRDNEQFDTSSGNNTVNTSISLYPLSFQLFDEYEIKPIVFSVPQQKFVPQICAQENYDTCDHMKYIRQIITDEIWDKFVQAEKEGSRKPDIEIPHDIEKPWTFKNEDCEIIHDVLNELVESTILVDISRKDFLTYCCSHFVGYTKPAPITLLYASVRSTITVEIVNTLFDLADELLIEATHHAFVCIK